MKPIGANDLCCVADSVQEYSHSGFDGELPGLGSNRNARCRGKTFGVGKWVGRLNSQC